MFTTLGVICTVLMATIPYTVFFLHKKMQEYGAQKKKKQYGAEAWQKQIQQKKKPE